MNRNQAFIRKVVYLAIIALLLFPLFYLGQPATRTSKGGVLAEMRSRHGLAQSSLGDIDPASEAMRLSTLGLRGVAANMLWLQANEYKMKEDWDHLNAVLRQIARLQPNFISVWEFQSHNLSYNVSVEFDDYRLRYHWVKKGIDFLLEGTRYNRDEPRLLKTLGWTMGHKIGRADEQRQFRRMFRVDEDFHAKLRPELPGWDAGDANGPDGSPDNWLVGRLWYIKAQDAVDLKNKALRGVSPLIFHSYPPMSRISFAKSIEDEGFLDEKAEIAWSRAGKEWRDFGERDIPTSWGVPVRLIEAENIQREITEQNQKLDAIAEGVREKLLKEREAKLSAEEKAALAVPDFERTTEQIDAAVAATQKTFVSHHDILAATTSENRTQALVVVTRLDELYERLRRTESYRSIVNYAYWRMRCEVEQKPTAVAARKQLFEARRLYKETNLEKSREQFELAWDGWSKIVAEYPQLITDITGEELYEAVELYEKLLGQMEATFPTDFKLKQLREYYLKRPK